jgi:hypothetical protein
MRWWLAIFDEGFIETLLAIGPVARLGRVVSAAPKVATAPGATWRHRCRKRTILTAPGDRHRHRVTTIGGMRQAASRPDDG